ncbi:MAG: hypothetical protein HC824_12330 [Synechococcales cyanobacterium RM1_1_8]|nr:hypothetical protein [Synechococcales cyanobacterium RM1_1_8]
MFYSTAYGLRLRSDVSLGLAAESVGFMEVDVEIGRGLPSSLVQEQASIVTQGVMPGIAQFCIQDGSRVFYEPDNGISDLVLGPCLLGSAMSVVLRQRGLLVLHAGCLDNGEGRAVALLGHSGWGKSTLVSALGDRGYTLLADDVLPIDWRERQPWALPSYPSAKLLPDAAQALGYAVQSMEVLHERTTKLDHSISQSFAVNPLPLKQLYILNWSDTISIEPLSTKEALLALLAYSRAARSVIEPAFRQQHFELCAQLAEKIPVYRFNRPKNFEQFNPAIVQLEEHFSA